jgi:hypothetical protein
MAFFSISTSNCHRQLRVRPRGVESDPLSVGELILELLLVVPSMHKNPYIQNLFVARKIPALVSRIKIASTRTGLHIVAD